MSAQLGVKLADAPLPHGHQFSLALPATSRHRPKHKAECAAAAAAAASATAIPATATPAPAGGTSSSTVNSTAVAASSGDSTSTSGAVGNGDHAAASSAGDGTSTSGPATLEIEGEPSEASDVMQALGGYLNSHAMAAARDDPQRAAFEAAVLKFVRGEYRVAGQQLLVSYAAAREAGRLDLAGDALRWLGHAHNKLGDVGRAAGCFAEGCQLAEECGNKKLQVCGSCGGRAGGQGCVWLLECGVAGILRGGRGVGRA